MVKYILVSGGVVSGVGKGLTASSIGALLKSCGWNVTGVKLDPYLNVDATMISPWEDGEQYVLADGGKVSCDMGNYERFLGIKLTSDSHITTGKIFNNVITKERRGDYLGKTVQVVPHITDEIQEAIERVAAAPIIGCDGISTKCDICIIELGGTIGDMESMPFLEALRQLRYRMGPENFSTVFMSLVPVIKGHEGQGVQKTKPTQHGVKDLRYRGLSPDMIVCRSDTEMPTELKESLAMYCQVPAASVINLFDIDNIYKTPMHLQDQGACNFLIKQFGLEWRLPTALQKWSEYASKAEILTPPAGIQDASTPRESRSPKPSYALPRGALDTVRIVLVTSSLPRFKVYDSLLSVIKGLKHAGIAMSTNFKIETVAAEDIADTADGEYVDMGRTGSPDGSRSRSGSPPPGGARENRRRVDLAGAWRKLREADAVVMAGMNVKSATKAVDDAGAVEQQRLGVAGRVNAIKHARENGVPFLGIGVGMHIAVVEAMRSVGNVAGANSAQFDATCTDPVVTALGKTGVEGDEDDPLRAIERLGAQTTTLQPGLASRLYGTTTVEERHCHTHVVNPESVDALTANGMRVAGALPSGEVSVVERDDHPFFLCTQFHPEFNSHPGRPSAPFVGLMLAATETLDTVCPKEGGREAFDAIMAPVL